MQLSKSLILVMLHVVIRSSYAAMLQVKVLEASGCSNETLQNVAINVVQHFPCISTYFQIVFFNILPSNLLHSLRIWL